VCHAPINISHFIDETSPFYGEDLESFPGSIEVTVSGRDVVLDATASTTKFYDKGVLQVGHQFESIFIKRIDEVPSEAIFIVDASKLSSTEFLDEGIRSKISYVISLNISNRLQYGTSCPSVLRAMQGGTAQSPVPMRASRLQMDVYTSPLGKQPQQTRRRSLGEDSLVSRAESLPSESVSVARTDSALVDAKKKSKGGMFSSVFKRRTNDDTIHSR
jgi:hypothetical protein